MTSHTVVARRGTTPPGLAGLVAGVVDMSERAAGAVDRRQPAGTLLPLVISWGEPLEVQALSAGQGVGTHHSFVAGLMAGHATTRFAGSQDCVQVYLTPLGVQRILGLPGRELAGRVLGLDEVAPTLNVMADRLGIANSWTERLALVNEALLTLAGRGRDVDDVVGWAWRHIRRSGGRVRVRELVQRSGWSHRHVTTRFAEQIGLSPKSAAGLVRFERAHAELGFLPLAEIAVRRGYADQSHLTREVVKYAGETPSALAAARRPTAQTALRAESATPARARPTR